MDNDPIEVAYRNCSENGNFRVLNSTHGWCDCDLAYFGEKCQDSGYSDWKNIWILYQVAYTFCYFIIAGFTWLHLLREMVKEHGNICRILFRLFSSPKYMVIFNLITISTTRCVYLSVDPFRQHGYFPRVLDVILYETIFSTTFSVFLVLLLVWTGLHSAFNIDAMEEGVHRIKDSFCDKYKYKIIHTIVLIILLFVYPLQFCFSYVRGTRNLSAHELNYVLAGCFFIIMFFIIVFSYYTIRFKQSLSKNYNKSQKDINHLMKAPTRRGKNVFERGFIASQASQEEVRKVQLEFLGRLKEQHLLKFFLKQVCSSLESKYVENLSDSEFETEMANMIEDDKSAEVSLMPVNNAQVESITEKEEIEHSLSNKDKEVEFTYRLSQEDMTVLNNIVNLSLVIITVSVGVIIVGILIQFTAALTNKIATLVILYIAFFLEVVFFYFVFQLFVKEVISSEYENLKIIGDIENFLKDNKNRTNKLVFVDIQRTTIYSRFKNFMNINSNRNRENSIRIPKV